MREQYEYQLAVAEELARAVKMRGKLTTFGVVLHDVDGEVFWLNHNNHQFADELVRLLDQGAEPMAYLGATTDHNLYLNVLAGQELRTKPLESFGQDWLNCTPSGPPLNFTLRWPKKLAVQ